jgi:hypothetical protein
MDFYHGGTLDTEFFSLKSFKQEPVYAGPKKTISPVLHGSYIIKAKTRDGKLIFAKAFNTLFEEWQDSDLVDKGLRVFRESRFMPFPRVPVIIEIFGRRDDLSLHPIWKTEFDPLSTWYKTDLPSKTGFELSRPDNVAQQLDVAIIADGYTVKEMDKFREDAEAFSDYFLETEPFDQFREQIAFHLVFAESEESGCDLPGDNIWKNTAADSRFYTLRSERYLTTLAYHKMMDLVAHVPHDQVILLVNSNKYGGGGIFNHFSVVSSGHFLSKVVCTHEFGHAFGGLADEYWTSSTAYVRHPDIQHEVLEPNITSLVDFETKWKNMVPDTVPVPTPDINEFDDVVGAYEGGRYLEKGIYRPYRNCRMKSNTAEFCPVCQKVMSDMIRYYSGL